MKSRSISEFWAPLRKQLEIEGSEKRADQQKAYMRGQYDFYGIRMGELLSLLNSFYKDRKATNWADVKEQVLWTWEQPEREWQMIGMRYLQKNKNLWTNEVIGFTEILITSKSWWDTVDFLASNIIGQWLINKPALAADLMSEWNRAEHIWKIRTSIIFQLKYKNLVNTDLLAENIQRHSGSKEFFINKASGWALRQYSKFNAEWVRSFIRNNDLSGLTQREGLKFLKTQESL